MKKLYVSLSMLGLIFLLTSSIFQEEGIVSSTALTLVNDSIPVLPDEPYDYQGIVFPDEIVDMMNGWNVEPLIPEDITNNIDNDVATLGRVLFYDTKLSSTNEVACASCHKQEFAFADGLQFSDGINETTLTRNSPNLNDIAWGQNLTFFSFMFFNNVPPDQEHFLFWDGRSETLEELVLQPILNPDELGKDLDVLVGKIENTSFYPALFETAFGNAEVTAEKISMALAQFVRSMISFETKYDKVLQGEASFTLSEERGHMLFEQSCANFCHVTPHTGTSMPMVNGLDSQYEDGGMAGWTEEESHHGAFRSPSLRNAVLTAPYMHDGRFETLEEVIDFYSEGIQEHPNSAFQWITGPAFTGFNFNDQDKKDLIDFLTTLTDPEFITDPKWSDPFQNVLATPGDPLTEKIAVFPNPVEDYTIIQLENPDGKEYEIRLSNLNGQVIKYATTADDSYKLNVQEIPAGIYMLEVIRDGKRKVTQLSIR